MTNLENEFLTAINEFYEKIKQVVSDDLWSELTVLLEQRQALLEDFFYKARGVSLSNETISAVKKIQNDDLSLVQVIKDKKQALEKQYLSLKQGRKSIKAYNQ